MEQDGGEAARWLRLAEEQGHAKARAELLTLALRWEAEQGKADAQFRIAWWYATGEGVPKDDGEAARWYRLAAEQGHAGAQYNLGLMYERGEGVEENHTEAARLYRLAAEQGLPSSQYSLGLLYALDGVQENDAEAIWLWRRAAEQGDAGSQRSLGRTYEQGYVVERSFSEAVRWYGLAVENGDVLAKQRLELLGTWQCFKPGDLNKTPLVALIRMEFGGQVEFGNVTQDAAFRVLGLELRWDFGRDDEGVHRYAFVIKPDGTGQYVDFTRTTSPNDTAYPSQTYTCELSP